MMNQIRKIIFSPISLFLGIVVIGFLIYKKSLFFQVTYLDDNVWLLDYGWYLKNPSNIPHLFAQPDLITGIFYRPILNLSFMLNAIWAGSAPFLYHLTNIIIHILNSWLIFVLLKKFRYPRNLSYACTLLFIVHPVLTQAVVWIPGRTDSLLALFIFLSFVCFIKFLESRQNRYYLGTLLFFILAFLTKETTIVLPLLCVLYENFIFKSKRPYMKQFKAALGWGIVVGALLWIRAGIVIDRKNYDLFYAIQSFIENMPSLISYVGKIFLPLNLSVLPIARDTTLLYGIITVVCLTAGLFFSKQKRMNYVWFGLCWFVLFLLPSFVFSFLNHEYRVYVPILGCLILMLEMDFIKGLGENNQKLIVFFGVLIILLANITFRHSDQFKDRFTFWGNAVETSPHSPLAHRNLGAMYHLEGSFDKAEVEYKKAGTLNAREPMIHNNLGLIYATRNKLVEAEEEYKLEMKINPLYDNVYYNAGLLYLRQKRFQEAEAAWKKTIELNPKYIDAYKQLAVYYLNQRNFMEAANYIQQLKKMGVQIPSSMLRAANIH